MLNLLLTIISSALISILMRLSKTTVRSEMVMFSGNYAVCSLLSAAFGLGQGLPAAWTGAGFAVALGAVSGVLYLASFALLRLNIRRNGVVLAATFMKLGVLVPTLAAVLFYGERPSGTVLPGFLLALVAILVINYPERTDAEQGKANRQGLLLAALLIIGGLGDAMTKVFEADGVPAMKDLYLLCTFAAAGVCSVAAAIWTKQRFHAPDLLWGAVIGVPNYFSSRFLLLALNDVPGMVAFPVFNLTVLLIVTLAGRLAFHEKLSLRQYLGLGMILVALVLLNL